MAGEEGKVSGIKKFDGIDFGYWRMQIEDYLYGKKLHLPLLGKKLESMKDEGWNLLDRQVLAGTFLEGLRLAKIIDGAKYVCFGIINFPTRTNFHFLMFSNIFLLQ